MDNMKKPPVEVGEDWNLVCEGQGKDGDGICKVDGYVIFVPEAKIDERYKVEITRITPKVGFGTIVEVL